MQSLAGVRVLDLSRILAGPSATQLLGDLGADVVKIEKPQTGDDTRHWGPPFAENADGEALESAYFMSANRNKRSLAVDIASVDGAAFVRKLATHADVLVENFKVGGLARYGLDYESLAAANPKLIYASITGFGQTGPRAQQPGYDFLIQAMGGIMSLTGAPDGPPHKVGVGIADLMCGMYATVAVLAALRHRDKSGKGQHIDLSLFDCQLAWLANGGVDHLLTQQTPARLGNGHPHIVPYDVFPTADGHMVLAVGNDKQFERLCVLLEAPELSRDARYATNPARLAHRNELNQRLGQLLEKRNTQHWVALCEENAVPAGPVNTLPAAFSDPQAKHRGMAIQVSHPEAQGGSVPLLGNPINLSRTPVVYKRRPPGLGEHNSDAEAIAAVWADRSQDEA